MEVPNLKLFATTHKEVDHHHGITNNVHLLETKQAEAEKHLTATTQQDVVREGKKINDDDEYDRQRRYLDSLSPGYKFCPSDSELVIHYLMRKIMNKRLPPNKIMDVNIYRHNPEYLAANYQMTGEKEWYFFTPRDRKYRNGSRPNRAAGDGYWKATGADKEIKFEGRIIGLRKALVFYAGKPPRGTKTNWIMHEFKEPPKPKKRGRNDMRLDEWVLCKIYKKAEKVKKSKPELPENSSPVLSNNNADENQMNCDYCNVGYLNETNGGVLQPSFYNGNSSNDPCDGGLQPISSQPPSIFHNGISPFYINGIISSNDAYGGGLPQPSFHNELPEIQRFSGGGGSLSGYHQLPPSVNYGIQPVGVNTPFQYPSNSISTSSYLRSFQDEILSFTNGVPNPNNMEPFSDHIDPTSPSN